MNEAIYFVTMLASYLVGSIPFGYVIVRLVKGVDVREHGSKNIGATNAARVAGWGWFPVVVALDAAKGFLPVFFAAPYVAKVFPCPH